MTAPRAEGRAGLMARVAVGAVAISFGGVLIRLAEAAPPLAIAAWRLGIAGAILLPWALVRRRRVRIDRSTALWIVASGAALALHFILWIASFRHTSVASAVLFVTTHPIFVAIGSRALLHEAISRSLLAGIAVSLAGAVLIGLGDLRAGGGGWIGDLLALGGGMAAAAYFLIGRRVRRTTPVLEYAAFAYAVAAAIVLAACGAARVPLAGFPPTTTLYLALLGIGPQLIGHSTFNWALRHLAASRVSLLILSEPIGAAVLAFLLFRERPSGLNLLGGLVILAGIYLGLRSEEAPDASGRRRTGTRED